MLQAAAQFVSQVESLDNPDEILAELHRVANLGKLNVLGAWRVPPAARRGDRSAYTFWVHPSVPAEFAPDFWAEYAKHGRSFLAEMAWRNHGAFTMLEALRALRPTGQERWIQPLLYRHGIRDVFYCPNGMWMMVYWSPKVLRLDVPSRAALQLAAGAAAARLQRLTSHHRGDESDPGLSARQRAVLRLRSQGHSLEAAAARLGIGSATAKEHQQRAMQKLKAKTITEAVAEALRHYGVIALAILVATRAICDVDLADCWIMDILQNSGAGGGKSL